MDTIALNFIFNKLAGNNSMIDITQIGAPGTDYRLLGVPIQAYIGLAKEAYELIKKERELTETVASTTVASTTVASTEKLDSVSKQESTKTPNDKNYGSIEIQPESCCLPFCSNENMKHYTKLSKKVFLQVFKNFTDAQKEATVFVTKHKSEPEVKDGLLTKEFLATYYGSETHFERCFKYADVFRDNRHSSKDNYVRHFDPLNSDGKLNYIEFIDFIFLIKCAKQL